MDSFEANDSGRSSASASQGAKQIVVVGNGMVGFRFLEQLCRQDPENQFQVTVFGAEPRPAYDRVNLTQFFDGKSPENLQLGDRDWYTERGIDLRVNDPVVAIDPEGQTVTTRDGVQASYDHLVLATGSRPFVPPMEGSEGPGIFVYRTIEDLEQIQNYAQNAQRAAVIGGGLLGLEAAEALQKLGLTAHIVERNIGLLSNQLPVEGSSVLEQAVVQKGFKVHLNKNIKAIRTNGDERILEFQNGDALIVDMVVIASGIRPADELAKTADLKVHARGGFVINNHLETTVPNIFAIGECANHEGIVYGLVAPGNRMATTLANRFTGATETFEGATLGARLKLIGIDVATFGDYQGQGQYLEHQSADHYRRIVLRRGRLVGATTVGPWVELNRVQEAVDSHPRIWQWHQRRFQRTGQIWPDQAPVSVAHWPAQALICTCKTLTRGSLSEAVATHRCASVEALAECTGASTVCGSCRPLLADLVGAPATPAPTYGQFGLAISSALAFLVGFLLLILPPIEFASSVQQNAIDFLWRDSFWKLTTGYTLLGLCVISLVLSLRKRIARIQWGNFGTWRMIHAILGTTTLLLLISHTGFRMGQNLNFILMLNFLALALIGAGTGLFTALENKLTSPWSRRIRRLSTVMHIVLFWPFPILLFFHIFKVYYY